MLKFKRLFPATLFLIVTYAIFIPSSLFLENINEFSIPYVKILPTIFFTAFIFLIALNIIALPIKNDIGVIFYIAFIFGISLCLYIQGNFLNPKFPSLDGTSIDWSSYLTENIISISCWFICITVTFIFVFRSSKKTECVIKYISYFLSAVQAVSLFVLIITNQLDFTADFGFAKEDEFIVGATDNIIIFVIDSLQSNSMEEYITSDAYPNGQLDNFTFFDNAVSGGSPTQLGMPVLLTGIEYDPMQSEDEHREEIWNETQLYNDLQENNYDIRFYTTHYNIMGIYDMVNNYTRITQSNSIGNYFSFGKQLYKLTNFYVMPQFLKKYFWLSTDTITNTIISTSNKYTIDNIPFYEDLQASGQLNTNYEKAFRLYHLNGVHKPYNIDENLEKVPDNSISEQQQLQGVMKEVYAYIDMLKKANVYDKSLIIITGDHGQHDIGGTEANPAVLIKTPYESHILERNSAPVHFRNVVATMAQSIVEDYSSYGPSVYDITENSDVERLHTIEGDVGSRIGLEGAEFYRLIIPDDARENKYQIWNPYDINCIEYKVGDIIDYTAPNDYADKINYRLYKENGAAVASNELSICFNLKDHQNNDLKFYFTYSYLYNNLQRIRFYANGNKIEPVNCTNENIENENIIIIPKEYMKDGTLILRMVFPNAVTPNQLDKNNTDTRILSVAFTSMWLEEIIPTT